METPSNTDRSTCMTRRVKDRIKITIGIFVFVLVIAAIVILIVRHLPDTVPNTPDDCPKLFPNLTNGLTGICDNETDGGNWYLIQRRVSNDTNFERNWTEYEKGFGNSSSNFWLGLSNIEQLCSYEKQYELRFDIEFSGEPHEASITKQPDGYYYAQYSKFFILSSDDFYQLYVEGYYGTAGNSYFSFNNSMQQFSTFDRDDKKKVCAVKYGSGWWCDLSTITNPNGLMETIGDKRSAHWKDLSDEDAVQQIEMKVRRLN